MSEDTNRGRSAEEIEGLMYQSMATKMQIDGMDVTADDVRRVVDEQTSDTPPEPSAEDVEILNAMANYQAEHVRPTPAYVVRGALLYCNCGSHCRRLNLPLCHGVYILKHAAMHQKDCVAGVEGPDINITTFGVCSSPSNNSGGHVCLVKEAPRNPDGTYTGEPAEGIVEGIPCVPEIIGEWDSTHVDAKFGATCDSALTTQSFLVCAHNGLIQVWRSGQEEED